MAGSYWVPCTVLSTNAYDYLIRYEDLFEGFVERRVDPGRVRVADEPALPDEQSWF